MKKKKKTLYLNLKLDTLANSTSRVGPPVGYTFRVALLCQKLVVAPANNFARISSGYNRSLSALTGMMILDPII